MNFKNYITESKGEETILKDIGKVKSVKVLFDWFKEGDTLVGLVKGKDGKAYEIKIKEIQEDYNK